MQAMKRADRADLAVETRGLTKVFGANRAVDGVDLAVPKGAVYGFLGPNGAGKTTTIRILATLLRPDSGMARVLGHDVEKEAAVVRSHVSLTAQFASLDQDLTGFENLTVLGRLLGHSWKGARARALDLLEAFDLADAGRRPVSALSGGMRRRLDIAASLIVTPDLLFLDEPTTGLDPRSRRQVWEIVRAIVARGTTVLLTTQDLAEADQLAERIAVIDHGKIIAEGPSGGGRRETACPVARPPAPTHCQADPVTRARRLRAPRPRPRRTVRARLGRRRRRERAGRPCGRRALAISSAGY